MFRTKLSFAIVALLIVILGLAAALYWGGQRAEYYMQRAQSAQDTLEAYVLLSHDANRHFKEMLDVIVFEDGEEGVEDVKASYQILVHSLTRLRNKTDAEIDITAGGDEEDDEREELEVINELEGLLQAGIVEFERVLLQAHLDSGFSVQNALKDVLTKTIDDEFRPLIDRAIEEEREEVAATRQRSERLVDELKTVATVTSLFSIFFALIIGVTLFRNLSHPLKVLVQGVRRVAKGDLSHRIELKGRSEFTYLAKNFNEMTIELADQRQLLLNAQSELEQKVEARTRELQSTNKKLLLIDEGRRRFFADISHELRTPLTAIRGEAEVTARGQDKQAKEYRDALRRIVDLSAQLAQLVEDLLFLARSDTANNRLNLEPLPLDDLLRALCDDTQGLARKKQLDLQLDLPVQAVLIEGDALRLRQLILILIDNACRYSKLGGVIKVSLASELKSAVITVEDQGIGISEDEQNLVFERYFRSEAARKVAPSGTGLGLPLAKSIVEAHHGEIKLQSRVDFGTQVTITLPLIAQIYRT